MKRKKLLEVNNLQVLFHEGTPKEVKAVDNISFSIDEGEIFGLVGESGSGKSTTGRTILGLNKPSKGEIFFEGKNMQMITNKKEKKKLQRDIQIVFQDPYASLDAGMKVKDIIAEGLSIHKLYLDKKERQQLIEQLLKKVGLHPSHADSYPSEFSGGQRQRIGIARALAVQPKLVIADEPISALDVSIQAQIVNLLKDLQEEMNMTILFIAHDLSMVRYISDRIGVMYNGKLVEIARADELYESPLHPYTQSLLSAIPIAEPLVEKIRQPILYDESKLHKLMIGATLHEITPEHYVYCREEDLEKFQLKKKVHS